MCMMYVFMFICRYKFEREYGCRRCIFLYDIRIVDTRVYSIRVFVYRACGRGCVSSQVCNVCHIYVACAHVHDTHAHAHMHTHTHAHAHMHTHTHTCTHTRTHTRTNTHEHTHKHDVRVLVSTQVGARGWSRGAIAVQRQPMDPRTLGSKIPPPPFGPASRARRGGAAEALLDKVLYTLTFCSKCTRALIFQNLCQVASKIPRAPSAGTTGVSVCVRVPGNLLLDLYFAQTYIGDIRWIAWRSP